MAATRLSKEEAAQLIERSPLLPGEYIAHLLDHGWGDTPSGKVLYSGPVACEDIYGVPVGPPGLLVLGDDLTGYCFAYDPSSGSYGELDPSGRWSPWQQGTGFGTYVAA